MVNRIKESIIPCPECGTEGLFTCTSCKNEIKFSLQWNGKKKEPETGTKELKKEKNQKKSLHKDQEGIIEELTDEVIDRVVAEENLKNKKDKKREESAARQKQAIIDEIKTGLQGDIRGLIIEAVRIMKKDILEELKSRNKPDEPDVKTEKLEKKEIGKESSGTDEVKNIENQVKDINDKVSEKNKKEETQKSDIDTEGLQKDILHDKKEEDKKVNKTRRKIEKLKKDPPDNNNNNSNDFQDSLELWELYKEIINK